MQLALNTNLNSKLKILLFETCLRIFIKLKDDLFVNSYNINQKPQSFELYYMN